MVVPAGRLADVLTAAAGCLGLAGFDDRFDLAERAAVTRPPRAVCVLLVDGLGFHLVRDELARVPAALPTLRRLMAPGLALDVGFPSSTPISLTTLGVGVPAGEHGMVGLQLRDPSRERLVMAFQWRGDDPTPERWQPLPTVFERLAAMGGAAVEVAPSGFEGDAFTRMAFRGARFVAADTRDAVVAGVAGAMSAERPTVVYAYDPGLDRAGHGAGCSSAAWRDELAAIDVLVGRLEDAMPPGCVLLVTGDHGMVDADPALAIDLDDDLALAAGLDLVGGEPRARHLYCDSGLVPEIVARFRRRLDGRALVGSRQDAIDGGWFGAPVAPGIRARVGDVVVAVTDAGTTLLRRRAEPQLAALVGVHGGMHDRERHVPLLVGGTRRP